MYRFLAILLALTLAGCQTYDSYGYRDDGYYDDRYDTYYGSSSRYYGNDSYWYRGYPDYVYWSDYYSVLWPVYRGYYDPFYAPGFYYGVTWYPRTYFGLNHYWYSWPYYHAYAPYRYSYWDGYYDHWDRRRRGRNLSDGVGQPFLYGSARNEAERLALRTGAAHQDSGAQPGLQYDPFSAQRTSPLWRDEAVRGHYPQRGLQSNQRFDTAESGGIRSREELRRFDGAARAIQPVGSDGFPARSAPPTEPTPNRARMFDRGMPQPQRDESHRPSGWMSETPAGQDSSPQRYQRARPTPYFRDVGGASVPMTQQPADTLLERDRYQERARADGDRVRSDLSQDSFRHSELQRFERESRRAETMRREQQVPQREMFQPQPVQRYQAPPQQRFEAPASPRYEAPARSMDMERSRPERSESFDRGSAREELRRNRDED